MPNCRAELNRCEYCEEKPCKDACPADCSPADFIMAARVGEKSDYRRAGALIMGSNPLGWVCGVVCPDYFCMKACSRRTFDQPINIPAVQASVMKRAYEAGLGSFKAPKCERQDEWPSSARGRRDWERPACSPSGATR